jgi:hypothetical protein
MGVIFRSAFTYVLKTTSSPASERLFAASKIFSHLSDDRRLERFDLRCDLRIKNAFAAVASADVACVPKNAVARALRDRFVIEPILPKVGCQSAKGV